MGSNMRPTVFNDRVATALKHWHHAAKKHAKHGKNSESHTPLSSRTATPTYGMSPVHLLHNYRSSTAPDSFHNSPMHPTFENDHWDPEALNSVHDHEIYDDESPHLVEHDGPASAQIIEEQSSVQLPPGPGSIRAQHESGISMNEFTFRRGPE